MATRPLIIAHRGSSAEAPEHTARAYERAIAEGADALECDVRLTADGVPVCIHDRRTDRTAGVEAVVSARAFSDLSHLDYGMPAGRPRTTATGQQGRPAGDGTRHELLRLDELIDIALAASRPVGLSIEVKHPVRYAGLVEERVIGLLRSRGLVGRASPIVVRLMSFAEVALRRCRVLAPEIPTVFLMDRIQMRCRAGWLPAGAKIAGPSIDAVKANPEFVARAHHRGCRVHTWVVDSEDDVRLCRHLGVDAVITNRPGAVLRLLESG